MQVMRMLKVINRNTRRTCQFNYIVFRELSFYFEKVFTCRFSSATDHNLIIKSRYVKELCMNSSYRFLTFRIEIDKGGIMLKGNVSIIFCSVKFLQVKRRNARTTTCEYMGGMKGWTWEGFCNLGWYWLC